MYCFFLVSDSLTGQFYAKFSSVPLGSCVGFMILRQETERKSGRRNDVLGKSLWKTELKKATSAVGILIEKLNKRGLGRSLGDFSLDLV